MKRGAAIAVAVAALFAAGEAGACSLNPVNMIFHTAPTAVAAEVTKVRLVWPREWERGQGFIYEAEFSLIGPVRARTLPTYRWASRPVCSSDIPVKRGEQVWLLLESDEAQARRQHVEIRTASNAEDPSPASHSNPDDYRSAMVVYPYTDDMSEVRELLNHYYPARLYVAPPPPPPPSRP